MAYTRASDGIRLHYEVVGRRGGEPVLMIQGLGADKNGWNLQRMALAPRYRTIALDNRGAGRSDKPFGTYSLEQMADDAIAVLDAAGVRLGPRDGRIDGWRDQPDPRRQVPGAGALARSSPARRAATIRGGGSCWRNGRPSATERGMGAPREARRSLGDRPPLAAPPLRRRSAGSGRWPCSARRTRSSRRCGRSSPATTPSWSSSSASSRVPTLVIVGNQDILTPRGDSEELAERIPGAELVVISGAAHGFMVEHWSTFNRVVLDFLARAPVPERRSSSRPTSCQVGRHRLTRLTPSAS